VLRIKLLHQIMCNLKQGVVWLRSANTIDALENRSRVEAGCKGRVTGLNLGMGKQPPSAVSLARWNA
jgi:hypothetical protein